MKLIERAWGKRKWGLWAAGPGLGCWYEQPARAWAVGDGCSCQGMRQKHTILTHEVLATKGCVFFMKIRGDGVFCHGEIYLMLDRPGILGLPRKLVIAKDAFVRSLVLYVPAVCV